MQTVKFNDSTLLKSILFSFCAAVLFILPDWTVPDKHSMSGKVMYDNRTNVDDAMISILDARDKSLVYSGLTNDDGSFNFSELKPGKYLVAVGVFGTPYKVYGPIEINKPVKHTILETFYIHKSKSNDGPVIKTTRAYKPVINTSIKIS